MGQETDLSKATKFAVSKDNFVKLIEGDLEASINFLMFIREKHPIRAQLIESMYQDYLREIEKRGKEDKNDNS